MEELLGQLGDVIDDLGDAVRINPDEEWVETNRAIREISAAISKLKDIIEELDELRGVYQDAAGRS